MMHMARYLIPALACIFSLIAGYYLAGLSVIHHCEQTVHKGKECGP